MQWGQIKTLFILCFLVLDIFLIQQFINNRDTEYPFIQESTREEFLRANIEGLDELKEESTKEPNLYAARKVFTTEEIDAINNFDNQQAEVIDSNLILSKFDEPVPIDFEGNYLETLQGKILYLDSFVFWSKNEASNTVVFFQKNNSLPIYFNQSALLVIVLDEEGRMVQYSQTMLEKREEKGETYDLIKAFDAVSNLYYNTSELSSGDEITQNKLGYHNLIPLPNGVQVLAPTWRITVNNQRNYFVNAIEMHSYYRDEKTFLSETINGLVTTIQVINEATTEDNELLTEMEVNYKEILESTSWSGEK
ncbi:hypothetical protein GH741_17170 [Aquibacillus halophilus]|uniref:Regulatory protein YycH-like domain-containing protein n=1 Tax=Aquibacillus halophilus TaxID=930132 RepID=A0A6A8DMY3_9BACI|nr:two-component system regulatory protein YycI [Aquibacillus halophilus]MRH44377.1 hypothetical protein [Aquibacillus halophilus]